MLEISFSIPQDHDTLQMFTMSPRREIWFIYQDLSHSTKEIKIQEIIVCSMDVMNQTSKQDLEFLIKDI